MNEEIKEILIFIENKIYPKDSLLFEKWSFLKDYITNLQQELERYKHYSKTTGIEEILEAIKDCYDETIPKQEFNRYLKYIEDYITNLQEENERLKKLEYKFFYCSEDEESFTLEDYLELGNKVYDLEQENERLSVELNKNMIERNNYLSRVEKAIEVINTQLKNAESNYKDNLRIIKFNLIKGSCTFEDLLNILQDEKDE